MTLIDERIIQPHYVVVRHEIDAYPVIAVYRLDEVEALTTNIRAALATEGVIRVEIITVTTPIKAPRADDESI